LDPAWAAAWAAALVVASACSPSEEPASAPPAQPPPAAAPAASDAPPPPPELYVEVEAVPDEGPPPLEVKFTVLVEDNQGKFECEWNFGDNTPMVKTLEPTHVFQNEGDYEVIVTCRDEKGVSGEGDTDVFVEKEG
jgi:PKD repeat protein